MQVGHGLLGLPEFVAVAHGSTNMDPLPDLCAAEAEYVHERAVETRRRNFTVGRYAAHCALDLLKADSGPILRGDHGQPIWPSGVVGSITHAGETVAVAVARSEHSGGIGLDIEQVGRFFPELISHIAFGDERSRLEAIDETNRARATIELFSAKEALYKAFFPRIGEFFGFSAAEITPEEPGRHLARLLQHLDPHYPPDRYFAVDTAWHDDAVLASVVLPVDQRG
ncbi:MAG: 4'-phosphopantetheinyl transferase superfamily protein [Acidimicrobiia bacterium]|nr:4'-phosphopantetheinyl transferase superfamily protein [Acidimicrobiia bacterium]